MWKPITEEKPTYESVLFYIEMRNERVQVMYVAQDCV